MDGNWSVLPISNLVSNRDIIEKLQFATTTMIKKSYDHPPVPSLRQLAMEIEYYLRKMKELEQKKAKIDDIQVVQSELAARMDLYKSTTGGSNYERLLDVSRMEKNALIKVFNSLSGHGWKKKYGWIGQAKTSSRPPIKVFEAEAPIFDGVIVSEHNTSTLDLTAVECEGLIPEEITGLTYLTSLKLNINSISGKLPTKLSKFEFLEYLNVSSNSLDGELDESIFTELIKIKLFDLSFNKIRGAIPNSLEQCTKLLELNLAGNELSGELPHSLQNCTHIKILKLYNNQLEGLLPSWLSHLHKLVDVNLSQNKFAGNINPFYHCTKLKKLNISHNCLTEPVESNISKLQHLELLYLNNNNIWGTLPTGLCQVTTLQFLNLSHNVMTGELPANFGNLKSLKVCVLNYNNITGPAPTSISNLVNLKEFQLFNRAGSETLALPYAFTKNNFTRIFSWSNSVGVDVVSWEAIEPYFEEDSIYRKKSTIVEEEEENEGEEVGEGDEGVDINNNGSTILDGAYSVDDSFKG